MNVNFKVLIAAFLSATVFSLATQANAGDRGDLKRKAKAAAEALRATGEPMDRCTLNVGWNDDGVIIMQFGETNLQPGDELMRLNEADVSNMNASEIANEFRKIVPDTDLQVTIHRNNSSVSLEQTCSNIRPLMELKLEALDHAAKKDFDDCFDSFGSHQYFLKDSNSIVWRDNCASVSRNEERYDFPQLRFDLIKAMASQSRWNPKEREETVMFMRANEHFLSKGLGQTKFNELIDIVEAWPNDKNMWNLSKPDFSKFRKNAENAIRSSLIDPESAHIEWPYGFIYRTWNQFLSSRVDGYFTCGLVNARNRMGGYVGSTYFMVVLGADGSVKFSNMGTNADVDYVSIDCEKSIHLLPIASEAETTSETEALSGGSLAEELSALVELHKSGSLTDEEFEAAKANVINK